MRRFVTAWSRPMTKMDDKKWLRVEEAAVYANIGISLVRNLIKRGQLPAIRTGRYYVIDRLDLETCLQGLKTGPPNGPRKKAKAQKA